MKNADVLTTEEECLRVQFHLQQELATRPVLAAKMFFKLSQERQSRRYFLKLVVYGERVFNYFNFPEDPEINDVIEKYYSQAIKQRAPYLIDYSRSDACSAKAVLLARSPRNAIQIQSVTRKSVIALSAQQRFDVLENIERHGYTYEDFEQFINRLDDWENTLYRKSLLAIARIRK